MQAPHPSGCGACGMGDDYFLTVTFFVIVRRLICALPL
jgi:hypothetical protein